MNYRFNVEYYKDLKYIYYIGQKNHDEEKKADEQELKKRDNEIENFEFSSCPAIYKLLKKRLRVAGSRLSFTPHILVC